MRLRQFVGVPEELPHFGAYWFIVGAQGDRETILQRLALLLLRSFSPRGVGSLMRKIFVSVWFFQFLLLFIFSFLFFSPSNPRGFILEFDSDSKSDSDFARLSTLDLRSSLRLFWAILRRAILLCATANQLAINQETPTLGPVALWQGLRGVLRVWGFWGPRVSLVAVFLYFCSFVSVSRHSTHTPHTRQLLPRIGFPIPIRNSQLAIRIPASLVFPTPKWAIFLFASFPNFSPRYFL